MTTDVIQRGSYNLYIRYAAPFGEKYNFVYVNNVNLGSVQFAASNSFQAKRWSVRYILIKAVNTIAIVKEWGYFELDNIRLEKTCTFRD